MLHRLAASGARDKRIPKAPRALILTPTRELAVQIAGTVETFARPLGLRQTLVHGGVSIRPQAAALLRGLDVMNATTSSEEPCVRKEGVSKGRTRWARSN